MNKYKNLNKINRKHIKVPLIFLMLTLGVIVALTIQVKKDTDILNHPISIDHQTLNFDESTLDRAYQMNLNEAFYIFDTAIFEDDVLTDYILGTMTPEGFLLVIIPSKHTFEEPFDIKGVFRPLSDEIKSAILLEYEEFNVIPPDFAMYSFHDDLNRYTFSRFFTIIIAVFALIPFIIFMKTWSFKFSQIYKHMKRIGDEKSVFETIEMDFEIGRYHRIESLYIFNNYILVRSLTSQFFIEKTEILQCYKEINYGNGGAITYLIVKKIPDAANYFIVFKTKAGIEFKYQVKRKTIDEIYTFIQEHFPNCNYGYNHETQETTRII